jgi:hypothetical protein
MSASKTLAAALIAIGVSVAQGAGAQSRTGIVTKLGVDYDIRSGARILADELTASGRLMLPEVPAPVSGSDQAAQSELSGDNEQVNDPRRDYVQIFGGFRPFVRATQSETSMAAFGRNIVVTYNDSTGLHVKPNPAGPGLIVDRVRLSGFAASSDGGETWRTGYMPPPAEAAETFGDPSVGVDRNGVFYFANLAADTQGNGVISVNKSTSGGRTWHEGVIVQQDNGSDKDWLAVGRDPQRPDRDNIYVTWSSFQSTGIELRFGRSMDGGETWIAKTIYAPTADPDPTHPQNALTFTNPVVDQVTGTLYIPFLHFSNSDQDFLQMLISDDAGATFRFATFNAPGAPNPTVFPVTQPGEGTECGVSLVAPNTFAVNFRLTIHTALDSGGSLTGLPRYVQASRMTLQPAAAAHDGVVYLAWSNSTSQFFGDPAGKSNVLFLRSDDQGRTWSQPIRVNPAVDTDLHHVLPALALDRDQNLSISYYTQHDDGTVDLDVSVSHDGGQAFPAEHTVRVTSTPSTLPPTNIPVPTAANPYATTNYDRQITQCYALGEYQSVTSAGDHSYVAWGDMRNKITEPVNALDPISGETHTQEDVFFQQLESER